ncbi:RNA_helicase [Hexamita inflata]|uniref:Putative n=1 Tax=Hexamita inflata TaxID=28002 RepID=A0AA86NNJ1_9EUKA|nr:RNA helicase [Hexamita inflata]CAI9938934.1 RNA helicase [Hexamita inflata]
MYNVKLDQLSESQTKFLQNNKIIQYYIDKSTNRKSDNMIIIVQNEYLEQFATYIEQKQYQQSITPLQADIQMVKNEKGKYLGYDDKYYNSTKIQANKFQLILFQKCLSRQSLNSEERTADENSIDCFVVVQNQKYNIKKKMNKTNLSFEISLELQSGLYDVKFLITTVLPPKQINEQINNQNKERKIKCKQTSRYIIQEQKLQVVTPFQYYELANKVKAKFRTQQIVQQKIDKYLKYIELSSAHNTNDQQIFSSNVMKVLNILLTATQQTTNTFIFSPKDEPLPVFQLKKELDENTSKKVIIQAATGSGKTLLVPLYLAENSKLKYTFMTEPKQFQITKIVNTMQNIVDSSITHIANGINEFIQVMNQDQKHIICVVTPLDLLKYIIKNNYLIRHSRFILDEFHERPVVLDALFSLLLKNMAQISQPNQIVLMSATPNKDIVNRLGNETVIFQASSQTLFHIEKIQQVAENYYDAVKTQPLILLQKALKIMIQFNNFGDILMFLPGKYDCKNVFDAINIQTYCEIPNALVMDNIDITSIDCQAFKQQIDKLSKQHEYIFIPMMLNGWSTEKQREIVSEQIPQNCIKIIIGTNIAESSVTFPKSINLACRQNWKNQTRNILQHNFWVRQQNNARNKQVRYSQKNIRIIFNKFQNQRLYLIFSQPY